jgi:hypothetical protein
VDRAIKDKTFYEVCYKQLDAIDPDEVKDKIATCLGNFFNSRWYRWLIEEAIIQRDNWVIEPKDYGEMRINGLKVYCKVDFLFPASEGKIYILDWKTGKVDIAKYTRQMKGYVLYAKEMFNIAAEQVRPVIAYLGDNYEELDYSFTESDLGEFATWIALETEEMYRYCESIEENIPKAKSCFPQESGNFCGYCNYKEFCGR